MKIDHSNYYWQNETVRLRRATIDDWDMFYLNYFDSDARFFLDSEIELPRDQESAKEHWRAFIENTEKSNNFAFTVETLNGEKVGGAYLNSIDERNGTFGVGIVIDRNCRGKGYGLSTMRIVLDYAFNERRLHKYNTFIIEGNIASETMMKKLGCKHEGVVRETIYHQGKYWSEVHYGMTADEFNEKWKKPI